MKYTYLILFAIFLSAIRIDAQDIKIDSVNQNAAKPHKKKARKMYVFVVGVNEYEHPSIRDLTKPVSDADTIAFIFTNPNNEIMKLTNSEAKADSVRAKMERFFSKSTRNDNVLFFFSGHGNKYGFICHDYLCGENTSLSYSDIKQIFNKVKAHGKFIFADACFSGGVREKADTTKMKQQLPTSDPKNNQQVVLFLSSRGYETSFESAQCKNGFFTTYLAEALRGKADANHNNNVTAIEMYKYVSGELKSMLGNAQHCVMWGNFDPNLIVMRLPKKDTPNQ